MSAICTRLQLATDLAMTPFSPSHGVISAISDRILFILPNTGAEFHSKSVSTKLNDTHTNDQVISRYTEGLPQNIVSPPLDTVY